jgi:peptidoglycan-associated lipoprotein
MKQRAVEYKATLLIAAVALMSLLVLWGCPKKADVTSERETPKEGAKEAVTSPSTPTPSPGSEAAASAAAAREARERAQSMEAGLQPVYFDFDRALLRDDAKIVIKANAEWLKANTKVKVRIEGNCDERGTKEYNQALGQRRSVAAKQYLVALGVASNRITLISYGKEKQVCTESTEECWQKNRRDDFIAVSQ